MTPHADLDRTVHVRLVAWAGWRAGWQVLGSYDSMHVAAASIEQGAGGMQREREERLARAKRSTPGASEQRRPPSKSRDADIDVRDAAVM